MDSDPCAAVSAAPSMMMSYPVSWGNSGCPFWRPANLLSICLPPAPVGKPMLQPPGNGSIPSSQLEATAAHYSFSPHFYINANVCYEV